MVASARAVERVPRRRDALRNRERLLRAADELVGARGVDVPLEEISRAAGLGIATLYRNFRSRQALLEALLAERLERFAILARESLAAADARAAFEAFLVEACESQARDRALLDALSAWAEGSAELDRARTRIATLLERLIERTRREGGLREDFELSDLTMLFWAVRRIAETTSTVAPQAWRRHLALVLDALPASTATALPGTPLTRRQLRTAARAMRGGRS
jgi:AcrR family transcriptional regulator